MKSQIFTAIIVRNQTKCWHSYRSKKILYFWSNAAATTTSQHEGNDHPDEMFDDDTDDSVRVL